MTTLCLDLALENSCRRDLHEWLGGAWALLFSNPEDFHRQAGEKAHWLQGLRQEFGARDLRAVAVKRDGPPEASWIDELHFDRRLVRLREPSFVAADPISFAARVLRGDLLSLRSRFVLLIDGSLKRRRIFRYGADRTEVSSLDLLATVDALRYRRPVARAA